MLHCLVFAIWDGGHDRKGTRKVFEGGYQYLAVGAIFHLFR
jgi:hypothetical protein